MYGRRASDYSSHMSSYDEKDSAENDVILEEEESAGDGQPQPPTDIFKGQDLPRSDTPETYLTDIADRPDISLFCDQCQVFVAIRHLKHHRAYHNSLLILNYKGNNVPETPEQLLKKRNTVLRKMKKEASLEKPIVPRQIQLVNDAYELLKSDLEDTFEACRQVRETVDTSCRGIALNCSPKCVYALGMCSSSNSKWKSEMEDTKIYQDSFGENMERCYLGLFDGYHGRFSAEVAASLLHIMLLHELMKFDSSLSQGPKEACGGETDISHHRFVFGSAASLDGQTAGGVAEESSSAANNGVAIVIQPDDEELTRRIIQLCEEKYENLLENMPPPTPKTSQSTKTDRPRHPMEGKIGQAFDKSYHLLDILLSYGKDEWSKVRWSGCSALSMVIESTQTEETNLTGREGDKTKRTTSRLTEPPQEQGFIHLANAGNVRALLVRGNRPYRLSKDHSPGNAKERERVIRQGGTLSSSEVDSRVNGILSTTRGLGNHGDPALKKCVLVEPHSCSVQIDQYAQFVVLATDGVWEILTDQEVASLLMRLLPYNQIPPPSKPNSTLDSLLGMHCDTAPQSPMFDNTAAKKIAITEPSTQPHTDMDQHAGSENNHEKGAQDAGMSEKTGSVTEGLRIAADLKTEVGSHFGDGEDHGLDLPGDQDTVSLPVHSTLQLGGGHSAQEQRRELAKSMAEHLVQAALLAGSRNNITVMVALLPGCGL